MRLDKYLKVSRLIKRRTVANEVADAGRILINGKVAKASQAVNAGDIIEVTFGNRPIKVRVLSDVEPRTKDVAREMYEIIEQPAVLGIPVRWAGQCLAWVLGVPVRLARQWVLRPLAVRHAARCAARKERRNAKRTAKNPKKNLPNQRRVLYNSNVSK